MSACGFFRPCRAHERVVKAKPAIFLGNAKAPYSERPDLLIQFPRPFSRFSPFITRGWSLGFDESAAHVPELLPFFGIGGVTHIANPLIGSLAVTKRDRITSPL